MQVWSRHRSVGGWLGGEYPVVKGILLANAILFLLQQAPVVGPTIEYYFVLSPAVWTGEVWQLVTYMFLHGGVFHVLFNMLAVWMFGKELEMTWGSRTFFKYYMTCGVGGGLTYLVFSDGYVYGASGAVFGVLLAFGMTFPDQIIVMSLLFPIKAKYMVMIYGLITFLNIARPSGDNIAHLAHLGGMIFGFFYLRGRRIVQLFRFRLSKKPKKSMQLRPRQDRQSPADMRQRVDAILDKINEVGYDHLTEEEKKILMDASRNMSRKEP